jgi:transposase InsO family protein
VDHVTAALKVPERVACRVLGQHRSTQRKAPRKADDEAALTASIVDLAKQYGRYGYRRITALLRDEGWHTNHKRVERIWRSEGLKVLWLNDGSCVRLRPQWPNHVWAVTDASAPPGLWLRPSRDLRDLRMGGVGRWIMPLLVPCISTGMIAMNIAGSS